MTVPVLVSLALSLATQKVELGPDDKAAFPPAPAGFDQPRGRVAHGTIETIDYESKSVGTTRHMLVYTPPGYSKAKKYPVLYLLHGITSTERDWVDRGAANVILDNLYVDRKLVPMIVVFPNGRARKNDRADKNVLTQTKAFADFEKDLLNDVVPTIDARYPTRREAKFRAITGFSMGGGQALNFGLRNLDTFATVGGFSPALNTLNPQTLIPDPQAARGKLKFLWVSCGDQDSLIVLGQRMHAYLKENNLPHVWHVDTGAHTMPVWKNDLYLFAQRIFRS